MGRYGTSIAHLVPILDEDPGLRERIVLDLPFCRAEMVHAVRHEMARTLEDVLRRRIPVAILSPLSNESLGAAADLVGKERGWSEQEKERQIKEVQHACQHRT